VYFTIEGICSSLLAVIEQLREPHTEDTVLTSGSKGKRRKKNDDVSSETVVKVIYFLLSHSIHFILFDVMIFN